LVTAARLTWLVVPFGALLGTFGSSSCIQIGPSDNDGGAGAPDDAGTSTPQTVEQQCTTIVTEFCARAQECYAQDPENCVSPGVDACCARNCALTATSTQTAINTCVTDLKNASCDDIDVNQLPVSCSDVVTY
jgi:hypothetical protein